MNNVADQQIIDEMALPVVRPKTVDQVGELVREQGAVYPVGGGTQLAIGLPPARPGVAVSLTELAEVIDYPARDMTITVQAGITMARLQSLLAGEKQRLPIDVPFPDRATLGGTVAANISGARRYGAGTLRDYVIGICTVGPDGVETKAGGRVVKNVAGYDLCKLHTGALGTLGILTQLTLKVRPLPELQALLTFGCGTSQLAGLLEALHRSQTRPMCLEVLNARAAARVRLEGRPWAIVVGFEDNEAAVNWQLQQAMKEWTEFGIDSINVLAGDSAEPLWTALAQNLADQTACLSFKANVRPSEVAVYLQAAEHPEVALYAQAGNGIVRGHLSPQLERAEAVALVQKLADRAVAASGNLVIERAPTGWKAELPVWGRPRGDWRLMQRVKAALDPRDVFNPGRMVAPGGSTHG
jgi:glycolate oxidase FAD binding subunit